MAVTATGGKDPELVIPIGASDAFTKVFKKFRTTGTTAAARVSQGFKMVGASAVKSFKLIGSAAATMSKSVLLSFAAISAAIIYSDKKANEFEESLISLGRVTQQPQAEIKRRMLELPPILGNLTALTKGYYQVISAGVVNPVKAIGTLTQASKIARITHVEQGEVVKGLTKVMAGFGDEIKDVAEASDILFTIEKLGQTSVGELIPVIGGLAKQSKDLSVNTYEMGAAFAQITQFAGSTEVAATQLRAVYTALLKPSEDLTTAIEAAGIESLTTAINQNGLLSVLQDLKEASGGTDESFRRLFSNVRAGSGAAAIAAGNFQGFETRIAGMKDGIGAAADAWDDWSKSGVAATTRLKANVDNFFTKLGESTSLTTLKNNVSDFLENNGDRLITFFTNLPRVAGAAFGQLVIAYNRMLDQGFFGDSATKRANGTFVTITTNARLMFQGLALMAEQFAGLLWLPIQIAFTNTAHWVRSAFELMLADLEKDRALWQYKLVREFNELPLPDLDMDPFINSLDLAGIKVRDLQNDLKTFNLTEGLGDAFTAQLDKMVEALPDAAAQMKQAFVGLKTGFAAAFSGVSESPEYQNFLDFLDTLNEKIDEVGTGAVTGAAYASVAATEVTAIAEANIAVQQSYAERSQFVINSIYAEAAALMRVREQQKAADKKAHLERVSGVKFAASAVVNTLDALNTAADGKNKAMFEALKVARIAQAVVNTYAMATAAFADTPGELWVRSAAAAAAIAFGLAQISSIRSTTFGGGVPTTSGGGASSGVTDTTAAVGATTPTAEEQAPQNITIEIKDLFGQDDVDRLIESTIIPGIERAGERDVVVTIDRSS